MSCEDVRRVDINALTFRIRDNIDPHTPHLEIRLRDGGSSGDDVPQWDLQGFGEGIQDFAWVPSFGRFAKVHDEEREIKRP